jgi:hypothetical protein
MNPDQVLTGAPMKLQEVEKNAVVNALRLAAERYLQTADNTPSGVQQYEMAQTVLNLADKFEQADDVTIMPGQAR